MAAEFAGGEEAGSLMAGMGGESITSLGRSKGVRVVEVALVDMGRAAGVSTSLATLTLLIKSVNPELVWVKFSEEAGVEGLDPRLEVKAGRGRTLICPISVVWEVSGLGSS